MSFKATTKKIAFNPALHFALLIVLFVLTYSRVIGSYFLADDFGEIAYVSEIFKGDLGKLFSNFTGNYMQIPSMAVYRPWLLISLAIDYAFWGIRASGYYLTNSIHYLACGGFIYFILRQLTAYWGDVRSSLVAFFSAAIFITCPLHCESVSWVVGRVDIVCLSFYLAGLLAVACFVDSRKPRWLYLSLAAFVLAITTKEMAIGLPVVACALAFLYCKDSTKNGSGSWKSEILERLKLTKPVLIAFSIATVVYFLIRFATLGTFTGGYTGSIGATQISSLITRWTDLDSYRRILLPFNYELMEDGGVFRTLLIAAYSISALLVGARLLYGVFPKRLILLILVFLATSLAPIYQLFGLGYNLEGMRFLFFATAPLAMLLPALLFAPWKMSSDTTPDATDKPSFKTRELVLSLLAMGLLVLTFVKVSAKNNSVWIEAGRQTRAVTEILRQQAEELKPGEKLAVLGIPKDRAGAHMILNGPTVLIALAPPFAKEYIADRVFTFDPVLYGRDDLINRHHFKDTLKNSQLKEFLLWDFDKRAFRRLEFKQESSGQPQRINIPELVTENSQPKEPILLPYSEGRGYITPITLKNNAIEFNRAQGGLGLEVAPLNIVPTQYDYLELTINISDPAELEKKPVSVSWMGNNILSPGSSRKHTTHLPSKLTQEGNNHRLVIPLSNFWEWYSFKYINNIFLEFPPVTSFSILGARLLPESDLEPGITIKNVNSNNCGTYRLNPKKKLTVEVVPLPGSSKVELEISKVNFFFENFEGQDHQIALQKTLESKESSPSFNIGRDFYNASQSGYSQIRARCFSEDGKNLGVYSAPLTLEILD